MLSCKIFFSTISYLDSNFILYCMRRNYFILKLFCNFKLK